MYREPAPREAEIVQESLREFNQLVTYKAVFNSHCEEVAELILPTSRNTFFYGSQNWPGEKKTQRQVDASGMVALTRFAAICDSLLTPRNATWHTVKADNDYVMKDRATQLWFEDTTKRLFKYRYAPIANFSGQNQNNYQSLGAFGNGAMFIDRFDDGLRTRGMRYKGVPFGEIYFKENHQGLINGACRWFRLTAYQAKQKWPDTFPALLQSALEQNSEAKYDFLHRICQRENVDEQRRDFMGMPYASYYVCLTSKTLLEEGGYRSFPIACSRYDQTPGEVYGRGPAMMVLPALKTLNAEKTVFLKQGHRAADPVLLIADDGLMDMNLRPGSQNRGGVNADGKPLVHTLPAGDIQISEKMMAEEKALINDVFLVTLFQILTETPQMTATEVIERVNEKGILLAPTVGRQQSEYLGPLIHRELDVLADQGLLMPMPPRLREAQGEYEVVYDSPLSRAMRAQNASGFWRTVDQAVTVANVTQDPGVFDRFDFDVAIPETAAINGVLPSWMADDEKMAAKRQARAKQQQVQQAVQTAPAQAALMSAKAKMVKAGMPEGAQGAM